MGSNLILEQKWSKNAVYAFIDDSMKDVDELVEYQICEITETEFSTPPLKINHIRETATFGRSELSSVQNKVNKINRAL